MQAACYSLNLIHAIPYSSKICNDSLCEDMEELMGKYFPTDLESREELQGLSLYQLGVYFTVIQACGPEEAKNYLD